MDIVHELIRDVDNLLPFFADREPANVGQRLYLSTQGTLPDSGGLGLKPGNR